MPEQGHRAFPGFSNSRTEAGKSLPMALKDGKLAEKNAFLPLLQNNRRWRFASIR
ncbi:hypothetical protein [Herbaspirillum autotrophicum]|uniref:hypothetical protein n=1 Tax=Herbaspirillum autotrophicum TaxID=180195 RepID=UPI0012ECFFFE|nr:hypothetical protein [Herbaspirillum autotrophicum]